MRRPPGTFLFWTATIALCACNSAPSSSLADNSPSTAEIPRFPAGGIATLPRPADSRDRGPGTQAENGEDSPSQTTQSQRKPDASSPGSGTEPSSTTSTPASSSSSIPKEDPLPGTASYVDAAYLKITAFDDGKLLSSFKFRSPQNEHQYLRLGNRRVTNYGGTSHGNIEVRSYVVFDVSQVRQAKRAQIQVFAFASSRATNGHGGYESPDPVETVEVRAVESHTPQELIDAPFNDNQDHELDLKIFTDLGDGELYASREFSSLDFSIEKLEPTPTASGRHSDCTNPIMRACGRWFTFELSPQAVRAINESPGLWATGWHISTISQNKRPPDPNPAIVGVINEWLFVGGFFDLNRTKKSYPDYLGPKPRLVLDP